MRFVGERHKRKLLPVDGNVSLQKTVSLREGFCRGPPAARDTKPFTATEGWSQTGIGLD